jgi:hypothetical protein
VLAGLGKFWRDLMTEDSNNSVYCPVRVFGAGGFGSYLGLSAYHVISHGVFDYIGFATGAAAIIGTVAGGIGIKSKLGADAP